MRPSLKKAIEEGKQVILHERSLKQAVRSLIDLQDRIEKYPFYEFTKEDKTTLTAVAVLLITVHESLYGEDNEG